jgi:hypothetical protein
MYCRKGGKWKIYDYTLKCTGVARCDPPSKPGKRKDIWALDYPALSINI